MVHYELFMNKLLMYRIRQSIPIDTSCMSNLLHHHYHLLFKKAILFY
eukprot:UN10600